MKTVEEGFEEWWHSKFTEEHRAKMDKRSCWAGYLGGTMFGSTTAYEEAIRIFKSIPQEKVA